MLILFLSTDFLTIVSNVIFCLNCASVEWKIESLKIKTILCLDFSPPNMSIICFYVSFTELIFGVSLMQVDSVVLPDPVLYE